MYLAPFFYALTLGSLFLERIALRIVTQSAGEGAEREEGRRAR